MWSNEEQREVVKTFVCLTAVTLASFPASPAPRRRTGSGPAMAATVEALGA
jgi:hypothetical protein